MWHLSQEYLDICENVCQLRAVRSVVSWGAPVSSASKTDRLDMTLAVAKV